MSGPAKKLPGTLATDPCLDSWLGIEADGTVTVRTGKVEIGQGIKTAMAMIAAEELDVSLDRCRVLSGVTGQVADEGTTSGSGSMEASGRAMRQAAAEARAYLVARAADHLGVAADTLTVADGTVTSRETNQQVTYWELMGGKPFGIDATGEVPAKDPALYTVVGNQIPELDARAKVTGGAVFVQDLQMEGLLHARVVRPPSYDARLTSLNEEDVLAHPGVVEVVRDGDFLAVIADTEWHAAKARTALADAAIWDETATLPDEETLAAWLVENTVESNPVIDGTTTKDPVPEISPPAHAALTLEAAYAKPYHMHGSIGPSAAVALFRDGRLTVWSPSQGPYPLRRALSGSLNLSEDAIEIVHTQGAGCYGHNGADDVSLDAALLSMHLQGRPVRVQWTREDEHLWEPYSPAQATLTNASLDAEGNVIDWNFDFYATTHQGRPSPTTDTHSGLAADWHREPRRARPVTKQNFSSEAGAHRNARPYYDFPKQRVVSHFVKAQPLRTSSLRGLGNFSNIFAIESFMDELAHTAGMDAVRFRLRHLSDPRARAVLEAAADAIGWPPGPGGAGRGIGIAFNRYKNSKAYAAVACEVEVDEATGTIRVLRGAVTGDAGQAVSLGGLKGQLEGAFLQATSWVLKERVRFDPVRVTSTDWESYPILTFPEAPAVEAIVLNQPGAPYLGSGEGSQGPTGAAIANAVFHATGVRLRELPFTPERVRAMFSAAGRGRG